MRIEHIAYFQYDELTDEAKQKAKDWYRNGIQSDTFMIDEIFDSFKALFKEAGITLEDWQLGAYTYNSVKFDIGDAADLKGKRALAWIEHHLLSHLRITRKEFNEKRKDYMSYGPDYRVGKVKPCPLTGICYDEDFLNSLQNSVKEGETLKESFKGLADLCQRLCEREIEYQNEDEQVEDTIRANGYEFTIDGNRA